ncbi:major facilitator superfamily transporter [Colletotrichum tofieldiae]|nr:major facilitator superfamily transporter [Colletotrichum tofieldiae]
MFLKDAEQQILITRIDQDRDGAEDLNRKNSVYPVFSTFKPTNSKRVVASATCLIGGGVGGITPSTAFMLEESPNYTVLLEERFGTDYVLSDWHLDHVRHLHG